MYSCVGTVHSVQTLTGSEEVLSKLMEYSTVCMLGGSSKEGGMQCAVQTLKGFEHWGGSAQEECTVHMYCIDMKKV